jgi:glycosyltransferase involved in cell wall biosynthesis
MRTRGNRILVLSHGTPHPHRGASSVVFFLYLEALRSAGYSVLHVSLNDRDIGSDPDWDEYLEAIGLGADYSVMRETLPHYFTISRRERSICPTMPGPGLISEIKRFDPDATVCFDILAAALAKEMRLTRLLIWLGDLVYQSSWYNALYDAATEPKRVFGLPKTWLYCVFWKNLYRKVLHGEKNVVVASKSSEKLIDALGAQSRYLPYPWPDAGIRDSSGEKYPVPTFIMFGTLSALGSKSAFFFLLNKVLPILRKQWGSRGFRILIAGSRNMPDWAKTKLEACQEMQFLGFVDDLAGLVARCHAVLAPIAVPVGNRSRIVTAMSMGAIVIAHKNTTLGNPELIAGENCFLAETAEEFAGYMRLASDPSHQPWLLGAAAREKYLQTFEPSAATRCFLDRLRFSFSQ